MINILIVFVGYKSVIHMCNVCICWALWVECAALWQSLVHQSDTSMLISVREVWCMFAGFVSPLWSSVRYICTEALWVICSVCFGFCGQLSPVTSCFCCIPRHEVLTAFILIGFVRNISYYSNYSHVWLPSNQLPNFHQPAMHGASPKIAD